MRRFYIYYLLGLMLLPAVSFGQLQDAPENGAIDTNNGSSDTSEAAQSRAYPIISADGTWAGVMLIVIGFAFAAAAVIGPIAHSFAAEHMPELHEQEEQDPQHASQHEPGHGR